jgi:hypothetical protein
MRTDLTVLCFMEIGGYTMSTKDLLNEAMKLKPEERFTLVEGLIKSLESEKRLKAYRDGKLKGDPMEELFKDQ